MPITACYAPKMQGKEVKPEFSPLVHTQAITDGVVADSSVFSPCLAQPGAAHEGIPWLMLSQIF